MFFCESVCQSIYLICPSFVLLRTPSSSKCDEDRIEEEAIEAPLSDESSLNEVTEDDAIEEELA